jgi:hypothetical protein
MSDTLAPRVVAASHPVHPTSAQRQKASRHHVIARLTQEKSGRLYCADEADVEIPVLEIYEAR